MKKLNFLFLMVSLTIFNACQKEDTFIESPDNSIYENSATVISGSVKDSVQTLLKSSASVWTKYLNVTTSHWYYQYGTISNSALTSNGFSAPNTNVVNFCKEKGCAAACIMSANAVIDGISNSPVNSTKFVFWCKKLGITSGSTKKVDQIREILKGVYLEQNNEYCVDSRNDFKQYLKDCIKSNKPVMCLVRYSAPNIQTSASKGTNHWVLVVGLSLTNATNSTGTGDTGSRIRYIDSGTQQLTNDCSISRIKEISYTTFLDAMVAADAYTDFNTLRIR